MGLTSTDVITQAVTRLLTAYRTGRATQPARDLLGATAIETAYRVRREVVRRREDACAVVVGRKIGLTTQTVQCQLGVDQPDFGVLLNDMDASGVSPIRTECLLQPRIEAEIAFVRKHDLDASPDGWGPERAQLGQSGGAERVPATRRSPAILPISSFAAGRGSGSIRIEVAQ